MRNRPRPRRWRDSIKAAFKKPLIVYEEDPTRPIAAQCPSSGELVEFYARLAEQVDPNVIETWSERYSDKDDSRRYIFLAIRSLDTPSQSPGELLGVLRAWREDATSAQAHGGVRRGIIQEIAVDARHRGCGYGRRLLAHLLHHYSDGTSWTGSANRIAANIDRDLGIIKTVYAIFLVEGFKRVIEAMYQRFRAQSPNPTDTVLLLILALILGSVGVRFFFAVGNIRRYVLQRTISLTPPHRQPLVIIHLPVLFLHAIAYFIICRTYCEIAGGRIDSSGKVILNALSSSTAIWLTVTFIVLLLLNAAWLGILLRGRGRQQPELLWIINNLVWAGLGFVLFGLACSDIVSNPVLLMVGVLFVYGGNSLVDLALASHAYVLRDALGGG